MKKVFEVTHEGHHIKVVNSWFHGEKLYVDRNLQDENIGFTATRATLTGILKSEDGQTKHLKVNIGATFTVQCRIFVDHVLIYPKNV